MLKNTQITCVMDRKQINSLVTQLFDGDIENLPEEFSQIEPVVFYEATLSEKNKRGYHAKIHLPLNYAVEKTEVVVEKIDAVRRISSGDQFEAFWKCFEPNLDISVWGSDEWNPRILPNGSVLIRNNQKVMAIEEQVAGKLNIRGYALKNDLVEIKNFIQGEFTEDNHIDFSILHRDEYGFTWTKNIPENFSDVGQTLIILSKKILSRLHQSYVSNLDNVFLDPQLLKIANDSDSGHCILRVFRHTTFIHSIHRLSDYYDTVLENYSYKFGEQPSEASIMFNVSPRYEHIRTIIQNIVREETPDFYKTNFIEQNKIIKMFLSEKITDEYANKKSAQVDAIFPIFGSYWDRPPSYYGENLEFWNTSQLNKGRMFLVNFSASHTAIEGGVTEFKDSLFNVLNKYKTLTTNIKLYLPICRLNYINNEDLFDFESVECNMRLQDIFKELTRKQVNTITFEELAKYESDEIAAKEFSNIIGNDYKLTVLFFTPNPPSIEQCHSFGMDISKSMNASIILHIPNYGFNHGYSCGEIDEGNCKQFLL